jgi:hypothetical protein
MDADSSQDAREGNFFPDHRIGLFSFSLGDQAQVGRNIDVGRTGGPARNQVFFLFAWPHSLVHECPCRANFHTGRTELAARFLEGRPEGSHLHLTVLVIDKPDGLDASQVSARANASGTTDAKVVVPDIERILVQHRKWSGNTLGCGGRNADVVDHILKFTVPEPRTTSFILRHIAGTLASAAALLLGAGQAGMAVASQNRD